ncbi:MAG TPA: HlyD family efflux transporter periplasmic adaptor subunit [Bacillota bacterium]|jgi:HlyD family secretion protein|nr:HlyD family efflux transporter periplasmic adaptor subunit [Bacillota bacterium]HQJ37719.1 HlyD family efflux transporter periplasmic adaptor subunit [Bacillota bacterium]
MNLGTAIGSRHAFKLTRKKIIIIAAIFLIAAAAIGINYFKSKNSKNPVMQQATAIARKGDLSVVVTGSGPISSSEKFTLTSNVSGTLTNIYFRDGDKVKAGDLIFEIDDKDTQLQIKQIKNSIAQAELTRNSNISDLEAGKVTAPIDGEILDLQAKEGDNISNNGTLLNITDKSKLKLLVPFINTYRNKLSIGQKVTVNAFDTERDELHRVEGTISNISTPGYTTGSGAESYNVGIIIENNGSLSEGMVANASINIDGTEVSSSGSNTLSYLKSMTVRAPSGGTVSKLYIENGQNVKKGDILAELENEDLELAIKTNDLKLEDLNTQLQTAEEKLLDHKIYAPFDGTLTLNDIKQGNSIKQGDTLGSVANYDIMEFSIDVDELDIAKIKEGQNVKVTIDALPETSAAPLKGIVSKVAVEGSSSNGVSIYPVTIKIEKNEALKGSMSANGEIIVNEKKDVLYVPVDAIQKRNGKSYVSVVPGAGAAGKAFRNRNSDVNSTEVKENTKQNIEQKIEMREVKTGISTAEYIEIVSGLKEGEAVIVTSQSFNSNNRRGQEVMFMSGPPAGGPPSGGGNVRIRRN